MRRFSPSATLLCVALLSAQYLTGCTVDETEAGMDEQTLNDFGARYTAAWNSGAAASVAAFYAEDGSLAINEGEPAVGRDAIAAVAQGFMTAFPDMVLAMDSLVIGSETAQYHWTFTGTNTGPGGTGNAVRFSGYEEWTFGENGLVAASEGHYDEAEYARQLGVGVDGS